MVYLGAAVSIVIVSPLSKMRPRLVDVLVDWSISTASSNTRFMYSSKPWVCVRVFFVLFRRCVIR